MLDGLKGATKGIFREGQITEVADGTAVLLLPKGPPANLLEQRRPEVEAALAAHFGQRVGLRLVVGSADQPAPAVAGTAATAAPEDDEAHDVHELENAPAAGNSAERLLEAFPGAELVEEP